MSHIVSIKTQLKDPLAVAAAYRRLGLPDPQAGTARLFSATASGLDIQLFRGLVQACGRRAGKALAFSAA